jgi:hypothetical protein
MCFDTKVTIVRELQIKVANLVLCGINLVRFPGDDFSSIETCRNIQADIIMKISMKTY